MEIKTDFVELKKIPSSKAQPDMHFMGFDLDNTVVMPTQLVGSDYSLWHLFFKQLDVKLTQNKIIVK